MVIISSKSGLPIRLTTERWMHIITQHPEMKTQQNRVLETVRNPQMIQAGDFGELLAIRFYLQTPLTQKYLVVAYRETAVNDGFILTAYFTRRPSARREIIWKP